MAAAAGAPRSAAPHEESKENRAAGSGSDGEEASPDKITLKEMLKEQSSELSSSRAALLQLLAAQSDANRCAS